MSATNGTTIAARGAAVIVAAVAGAASFEHIASVAVGAGEQPWVGYSLPLAIDGLIVVGVSALLEDKHRQRHGRLSARLAVFVGVVATLAANVASAEPTWSARLVAITAPVSFLLSVEVLTRTGRHLSTPDDTTPQAQPTPAIPEPAKAVAADRPAGATKRRTTAASRVAQAVAKTPDASAAQIAARLRVSERTVQRYWPHPVADVESSHGDSRTTSVARGAGVAPVPPSAFERPGNASRPNGRGAAT
jgi:putative Ca2+/H+ antiporter (TMEM165/GDT1 family)